MGSHRSYRAYLFDLDGTLVDTAPDLLIALNDVLAKLGHESADLDLARHWVGHGARVMIQQALIYQGVRKMSEGDLERAFETFIEHYQENIAEQSQPYPGVRETLEGLASNGIPTGVVTNKMERLSRYLLQQLDLFRHFGVLVGGDTVSLRKPHALPVQFACAQLGVAAHDAVLVGDSATDVESARAAGCDVICVSYGYSHGIAPEHLGADKLVDTFLELP